jgi:4-hydroxy 2-oxovalerate aldolase
VKLLDVTLRDGGFVNDFRLDEEATLWIIDLLDGAELDVVEIGYLTGLPENHGHYPDPGICYAWSPERIAEVTSTVRTPLAAMLHPAGPVPLDLHELAQSGLALVRVPVTPDNDGGWRALTDVIGGEGLCFSVNLTLATWSTLELVADCARTAEQAGAGMFYVADTNSAFLPHDVETLFRRVSDSVGLPLGFHAHDGKRLAHANVLAALRGGASWADASLGGVGRGAGNAATEVLHEIAGKSCVARYRILRALPQVSSAYRVGRAEQLWQQLCAFLDVWPPTIELFERVAAESGVDRYTLVAEQVLGRPLALPPREADLREMLGSTVPRLRLNKYRQISIGELRGDPLVNSVPAPQSCGPQR